MSIVENGNDKDSSEDEDTGENKESVTNEEDDPFKSYKDIKNFMNTEMNSLDVFDDSEMTMNQTLQKIYSLLK